MTNKKYLIIAILATFCLTATLFMIVPTKSQTGGYDARTDVNGDGTIDMADISMGIEGFMATGDPTLNVNVTNLDGQGNLRVNVTAHATNLVKAAIGVLVTAHGGIWVSNNCPVDGYSKVSINLYATGSGPFEFILVPFDFGGAGIFVADDVNFSVSFVRTYDVMNQWIFLKVINRSASDSYVYADIYLVA